MSPSSTASYRIWTTTGTIGQGADRHSTTPNCCAWPSPNTCCTAPRRKSRWVRYARTHLTGMFPAIPQQSGYNKRIRATGDVISAVITALARDTASWHEILRLLDPTPVPCAASRETVKRSDLVGHAGYGYCAPHSRFF